MSRKLKPLILPQLVEERRKLEIQQSSPVNGEQTTVVYLAHHPSSSSSDLVSVSPSTPTFSRTSHSRCSGSASSLDTGSSMCSDNSPASPIPPVATATTTHPGKNAKSQLPYVQEDPLERLDEEEEEDDVGLPNDLSVDEDIMYMAQSAMPYMASDDVDYDLGFLSETDCNGSPRQKRKRDRSEASFAAWGMRIGSRFQGLSRWRSPRRINSLPFAPGSDPSLEHHRPSASRAASSRSSSLSMPRRHVHDRTNEPRLPEAPAMSLFESADNASSSEVLDIEEPMVRASLERERSMATTPLLPPLMTMPLPQPTSLQPSPLQSPAVMASSTSDIPPMTYPTPPLSTRASVSSFRRGTCISPDLASPLPHLLEPSDAWSDRLGHANFTILPKPYTPDMATVQAWIGFREDWDLARINYTKHLARTGEHYGTTSKTYALTRAKWAEVERDWLAIEDGLAERLSDPDVLDALQLRRAPEDLAPASIPRMLDPEGKFPQRGDVDIVGPMARDAVMVRQTPAPGGADEKKSASTSAWLKNLVEKMGIRR
ncbi:hypothetical protein P8C59_004463 [Phyllachora maydis]|uniref:Only prolin and serin are matching in the corresponding protein n=1 Tax=Phyllachora maydis TaxID=1825666 RepID=A0AAD9I449_9PEZI|nr:hypothetical protein P8C59_004463 [Phyllachora maydis]